MSVTLRKRKNADGTTTLRLDIYHNGQRKVETLKHLQLAKPSNLADREANKTNLQLAQKIAIERAAQLEANNYNMVTDAGNNTLVTTWMQSYIKSYDKKDIRNMQGVTNRFITYLKKINKPDLTFSNLDALLIEGFIEYLEATSIGEGARSYYRRFQKMIKNAYRKKLMKTNVLDLVEIKVKGEAKKKDALTIEEIKLLNTTPSGSATVKNAFLFSCLTGLRFCDVKALKWESLKIKDRQMTFKQSKTGKSITVPLNDSAIKLVSDPQKSEDLVFKLPTANGANKTIKAWVKRAGISKAITWHNGRHSFGTNLIFNEVDILTTSKLMGHTTTTHTQRYITASEEMKRTATDKINIEF
ncbi:tyrosine-type recombinase/integrase [Parasediminibacterium sp. JCM 36343]|uniref:tyrosine-type recombinase/integrase n=1 Tax=Parasediminibacterium sp. JCM 36343 TaxID=3374279 RepID=UPI0039799770